MKDKILQM